MNPNETPNDQPLTHGDDAGIQSPTTTGGDVSDERLISPGEGPVADDERELP